MGKINDVRELIVANPSIERSALVGLVAEKFSVTRALAHSYVYHASKKTVKDKWEAPVAKVVEKAVASKKKPSIDKAAKVEEAKAKNLETIKKVAAKKAKAKANAKIERVSDDFDPQLAKEEVENMINEVLPKGTIPKFLHDEIGE